MASRKKHAERPLWQAGREKRKPQGPQVTFQGRKGRKLHRELLAGARAQRVAAEKEAGVAPGKSVTARTGAWRFRLYLAPFIWLAVMASGLAFHAVGRTGWAWLASAAVFVTAWVSVASANDFPRKHTELAALISAGWLMFFTYRGLARPWSAGALITWAVLAGLWIDHYRWRLPSPGPDPVQPDTTAEETFAELAKEKHWAAKLLPGTPVPGGTMHEIRCRGTKTHIGAIIAEPKSLAAAFGTSVDQAYAEEHKRGEQDKGELFLLTKSTLEDIRRWNGVGVSPKTGLAVVGRFPDGAPVRERVLSLPRDGPKHTVIAGADGSGKTGMIHVSLCASAASGFIAPIILDPQEGQALLEWRDFVPYACGISECMKYLVAIKAAMTDRSAYLSTVRWCKEHGVFLHECSGSCRVKKGMGFFNPFLSGLPIIEVTIDEAPILLALTGAPELVLDLGKLGRKAGVRLRLAAQVPSVNEMVKSELRSLLVGGNVFCLRTGDKVSGNMLNIQANPNQLPKMFPNGLQTFGLGYSDTIDQRLNTPFRGDWVEEPDEVAAGLKIRKPDGRFAAKMAEIIASEDATIEQLANATDKMTRLQLAILSRLGEPRTQGQLISAFTGEATLTEVADAVTALTEDGKILRKGDLIEAVR